MLAKVALSAQTDPEHNFEESRAAVRQAIDVFEDVGDESGLADAYLLLARFEIWLGRSAAAEEACAQAAAHGRRAGDRLAQIAISGLVGPGTRSWPFSRPTRNRARQRDPREREGRPDRAGNRAHRRALLFAIQRRFDEARRDLAAGRDIHYELGAMLDWAGTAGNGAIVHLLAGEPKAAEDLLREALEALRQMGETGYTSTLQGQLAEALYAQERYDEAYEATELSERAAARDDLDSQVRWRGVRAKLLARQGRARQPRRWPGRRRSCVEDTDMVDLYAEH